MASRFHGLMPFKGLEHLCHLGGAPQPGRFGRLFPDLPPLYVDPHLLEEVGKAGGKLEDKGAPNLADQTPAGLIFFGQFIDHDVTLDVSSSLTATNNPLGTENVRTPTLDLDCVYGQGHEAHPYLFDGDRMLVGSDYSYGAGGPAGWLNQDDLPRTPKGTAIIGDPRNDENRIISQMQLGFLRFHNKVVDTGKSFGEAHRIVQWHYQWVVVNDFLRTLCGGWVVDDILANGRKVYRPECVGAHEAFIPIEFATAAFRFGHTMIPDKLRVQVAGPQHDLFSPSSVLGRGFSPVSDAAGVVDWAALLDSGNGVYERAGDMDARLAKTLLALPFIAPGSPNSLAVRNLLRAQSFLIPSGEQVGQAMQKAGATEITNDMIDAVHQAGKKLGFDKGTPLWLYLLAEGRAVGRLRESAQGKKLFDKGEGLGPVGARLVAEVLIGLLELDERSFLGANRSWSPTGPDKLGSSGVRSLYQLLTF